ncbi:hypothetical protein CY34DRAFT_658510 [Suillus luteus UH-Slu-Lm8-n1]|uniref:Uncharacterized protein n=1 Tax=Suillus luteus UH-Slu-Lm8-n1 TaxID=930992 RepID=A0A0C9ZXH2_9AGAM|nr:hypothetical protein CY34DRAFT_658510 [Suillus luteus UH-Slu-Lm8-n1]
MISFSKTCTVMPKTNFITTIERKIVRAYEVPAPRPRTKSELRAQVDLMTKGPRKPGRIRNKRRMNEIIPDAR